MDTLRFAVDGLPPAKSTAQSLLGPKHKHQARVLALLRAAAQACDESGFHGFEGRRLRLSVELHTPTVQEVWDATNYLGGIADVLEAKARRLANLQGSSLDHLEELVEVGLYDDDRQIKEVIYKEVPSRTTGYVVTLTALTALQG